MFGWTLLIISIQTLILVTNMLGSLTSDIWVIFSCLSSLDWTEFTVNSSYAWPYDNLPLGLYSISMINFEKESTHANTSENVSYHFKNFWREKVVSRTRGNKDSRIFIQLKFRYRDVDKNESIASMTDILVVGSNEMKTVLKIFLTEMLAREANYKLLIADKLIFSYDVITDKDAYKISKNYGKSKKPSITNPGTVSETPTITIGKYDIPLTTDLLKWGKIDSQSSNLIKISKHSSTIKYIIRCYDQYNVIELNIDNIVKKYIRDVFGKNNTSFTRIVDNTTYIIENGVQVLSKTVKKTQFIKATKIAKNQIDKYITLDIETRTINGIVSPYCISLYDGKKAWSYYLTDFETYDDMLRTAINSLMRDKYNNYIVYAHNLGSFDGVFLLKYLVELGVSKPIMRDGEIIEAKLKFDINLNKEGTLTFRDSLQIIKGSLRDLAKSFGVEEKSYFPYEFVNNESLDLNYVGDIPSIDLWTNITQEQFNSLEQENWSLKEETIKYCEQDCITLHQILVKFNTLIYSKWCVNINKFPTLPSLTFGIFKSNYMEPNSIPLITGQTKVDLQATFTGGGNTTQHNSQENTWKLCFDGLLTPSILYTLILIGVLFFVYVGESNPLIC